jgi:hypothetical protein
VLSRKRRKSLTFFASFRLSGSAARNLPARRLSLADADATRPNGAAGGVASTPEEAVMNSIHFTRTLTTTLFSLVAMAAVACSGGGGGGEGGSGQGNTGSTGDTGHTGNGSSSSGGSTGFDWSGTWNADLAYSVACDFGFGNIKNASWTQTDTLKLAADGSGGVHVSFPTAVNFEMSGTGNDHLLTITGQYPAKDDGGGAASSVQTENTVTIKLDSIQDQNNASGTISGQFKGEFGQDCTMSGGTAKLYR